jgi:hypothetical protein
MLRTAHEPTPNPDCKGGDNEDNDFAAVVVDENTVSKLTISTEPDTVEAVR